MSAMRPIFSVTLFTASPQKTPMTPSKQRPQDEGPPPYNGMPENERRPGMPKPDSRTLPRDMRGPGLRGPDSRSSPALNSMYLHDNSLTVDIHALHNRASYWVEVEGRYWYVRLNSLCLGPVLCPIAEDIVSSQV